MPDFSSVGNAMTGVLTLLILIAVGFFFAKRGTFDAHSEEVITRLASKIAIPALMFINAIDNVSLEFFGEMGLWILLPAVVMIVMILLGMGLAQLLKLKGRGLFVVLFAFPNTLFIGLPVTLAIFGDAGIPYVMCAYLCNTLLYWTVAIALLKSDAGQRFKLGFGTIKQVFTVPLFAFILGSVCKMIGLIPPVFLIDALRHAANMTIPLTLILTGIILASMTPQMLKLDRAGVLVLVGRLMIAPALSLLLTVLLGAPTLMQGVYAVQAAMPVMIQSLLSAREIGANYTFAAQMLAVSTVASIVFIPLLMFVMAFI
ncbi:AEC family transporter [Oscillospiraceae bacterium OttesenSCG-928-F05]|nr:AEC family transporter [Oscillospiraceae bacterium OttesenSCG-928-F05]